MLLRSKNKWLMKWRRSKKMKLRQLFRNCTTEQILNICQWSLFVNKQRYCLPRVSSILKTTTPKFFGPHCVCIHDMSKSFAHRYVHALYQLRFMAFWDSVKISVLILCDSANRACYGNIKTYCRHKNILSATFLYFGATVPSGPGPPNSWCFNTQWRITIGRTPLDEWSARRRDLYLKTHNTPDGIFFILSNIIFVNTWRLLDAYWFL